MNQIQEDMTQDDEIASPLSVVEKPKSEFLRPPYSFKGEELHAYTYGYELLFNQVRHTEDKALTAWLAFIFLLKKRNPKETDEEHKKWGIEIAWDFHRFHSELMTWMDEKGPFTVEEQLEAQKIYSDNMESLAKTIVEPVPTRGKETQKKTSRQRKPASSMSCGES